MRSKTKERTPLKTMKRLFALVLAVAVTTLALPFSASAAVYEVGPATTGIEIVSGTPDPNVFTETGIYKFTVQKDMKLNVTKPGGNPSDTEPPITLSGNGPFKYGGLTLRNPLESWTGGQTFAISIIRASGDSHQEPGVILQTDLPSTILKNRSLDLTFKVIDYNMQGSAVSGEVVVT
ncbi:MAG: hypothetical protein RR197_07215, partial [Oscillospiraceae bacterium]